MAHTKTTARRSTVASQAAEPSRPSVAKGKRPMIKEEPLSSPPPCSTSRQTPHPAFCPLSTPSQRAGTSTSSSQMHLLTGVVKDVLQELINLSKHLITSSKQERKLVVQNENALRKFMDRFEVLLNYVDNMTEDEHMPSDPEDEEPLGTEDEGSNV
ncbi:uncharacterized protein [Arachis hypogaea]|uniref:uncharacterized protein n=1 Tax=Arachis hypogaea TaxID=3818 RepID=UPI000A2C18B2|nr:uncharacterized protein LOC112770528 [Arachis hypogaea]